MELRKILAKVEATLRPYIGMADPYRYGWTCILNVGIADGDVWSPEQVARYQALIAQVVMKGIRITAEKNEAWNGDTIRGRGMFSFLKSIPAPLVEIASELSFIFAPNSDANGIATIPNFGICPITVLVGPTWIDYRFGANSIMRNSASEPMAWQMMAEQGIKNAFLNDPYNTMFDGFTLYINGLSWNIGQEKARLISASSPATAAN
jgi:hypothetical protein